MLRLDIYIFLWNSRNR